MIVLMKTAGFSLALMLVFLSVTYLLPQMEERAPVASELDLSAMTLDSFVAAGEDLYNGRGNCALCHNALGRAPDLLVLNAVQIAEQRLSDPSYQGNAKDAEGYLHESMVDPGIYVVKGFGKKGTQDTESPMSAADKAPTGLSLTEIDAIVAFLQAKDGNPVTVALPAQAPLIEVANDEVEPTEPTAASDPVAVLDKFSCRACHSISGTESTVGPGLDDVGIRLTMDEIRQSIVSPDAVIAEAYPPIMPDISASLTVKELEILVQFLSAQRG
ncbi:MAG: hypothetical protein V3S21_08015 [Xanthomonadales bacterium]